jgi:hypothetical protein
MTTNLLENLDDAFRSRINIHLCYKLLTSDLRLSLWKRFLTPLGLSLPNSSGRGSIQLQMLPPAWDELAAWELNGREIKNTVRNVHLWCLYNGFDITLDRIESAIGATAPYAQKEEGISESLHGSRKRPRLGPA